MAKRCDMCFQTKDTLQPVIAKAGVLVCKSCNYKISAVTAFLEYHGIRLQYELPLSNEQDPANPEMGNVQKRSNSKPRKEG